MSAYFIAGGYLNAFAEENPVPEQDAEAIENGDIDVTISSEGQGSISPAGETLSVASGTVYKVYGNELTIGDKKYTAVVNAGYTFCGWYLNDVYMDIYGTITQACTIKAIFTSDDDSCTISGVVNKDGSPYHDAAIRVVSEDYPSILVSTASDQEGKFSLKVPRSISIYLCAYANSMVGYSPLLTSEQTSGATFNLNEPIAISNEDPENCLLTGTISAGSVVKDAAIVYLWDEHSSGSYDFHNNLVYSNNLGAFYCLGKHATNAYILYFAPGIRMSVRRVSASETQHAQATVSYNVKKEGVPVYINCPNNANYSYDLNLATLDCADVINYNFNSTINLGLDNGLSVKFNGDTLTYNMQDDVDPWPTSNAINIKYSITAKPNNEGSQFKQWRVNGQPVVDGTVIQITESTVISADVVDTVEINGHVKDASGDSDIIGADVFFINDDETQTYAHSVSNQQGQFQ